MTNFIKPVFIFCLLFVTCVITVKGQVLPGLQNSFSQYNLNALQEKLFVHTDKDAYTTGELIWFKIYSVNGADQKPLDLSKVAYVEILDVKQNPVIQAKIEMKNGSGSGSIYIPATLKSGMFLLRAYTSWMKNFSPDFYFSKKLIVVNPLRSPELPAKNTALPTCDIQFFPEGGNMVTGIKSVVGFKVVNQYGTGIDFKGVVLDKNNDTIAKFKPLKFGIGHFQLMPEADNTYHAVIKIAGNIVQKELPVIKATGYVLNVKNNGSAQLIITVSTNLPATNVYLFAHTRGNIKVIETAAVNNGTATFNLDKNKLGDGISQLTIFNSDRQPVCERLYFNLPSKILQINTKPDQDQYNTRKKVSIAIDAKDESGNPVVADLSLSVFRIDSLQHPAQADIQNYLMLTSDIKGNIESPDYYFSNKGIDAEEAADNLMLTQGWRRFNWSDVLQNKAPAFNFLPEFNGPIVNAILTNQLTGKPVKDIIGYLAIPGKRVQMYTSNSDSLGRLMFNMKSFFGQGEIILQTNTQVDSIYHMDVLSPFSDQFAHITLSPLLFTPGLESTLRENNLAVQVQNVFNGVKLRQFYAPDVDSTAFYGTPYKTYLLSNYTRFTTMEEVMREYVTEVNILLSKGRYFIKSLNETGFINDQNPLILIDGVPFFDVNKLFSTDPLKIYKLEDYPYKYYWGASYEAGIYSFTSYKGDLAGVEIDPHAVVMDYDGLEVQRQFYSPAYDTDDAYNSRIPDLRDVLYWAPNVITQTQGKYNLSFYTSDKTGHYIGNIQGITAAGNAGSSSFRFTVVK